MKTITPILYALVATITLSNCKSSDSINEQNIFQGKVERDQVSVVTKITGRIKENLVHEGDQVKEGQTLFVLELPEVDAKKSQAEGAVYSADAQYNMAVKGATKNQIKQLHAKVDALKEQLDFAEKSNKRIKNMLRDSLVPQQTYDEIYTKYQGAKNQYIAALAELTEAEHGARIEQQHMALGQKERALGALKEVDVADSERNVKAPQDMTIETVNLRIGELATAGYSIATGILDQTTFFRFSIPENLVAKVKKDQIVTITVPYKNNLKLKGKIVYIKALSSYANINTAYPDINQQQSLYEVKVVPTDTKTAAQLFSQANVLLDLTTK
ncbi:HlyD family secretion protein [Chishuiella sp.]|uniref:HlyD family secretion protein n=1 Tax=Chishuiella sp. TaxID=1969467 RepID=UPI0028A7572C|nr:efflux RND transporter periplasmic adaptor subunit [Chishuiella sp.]